MMVLDMSLEVPGEVFDALAQERNLHFGGAGIRLVTPEPFHDFLALGLSNSHKSPLFCSLSSV